MSGMNHDDIAEFNIYREGKVHVLNAECDTCIFRPAVRPVDGARVAGMVRETKDDDGATVICHHTLDTEPQANAICRGWFDRFADRDNILRMAKMWDCLEYVDEP
jgi:hypothetical protein